MDGRAGDVDPIRPRAAPIPARLSGTRAGRTLGTARSHLHRSTGAFAAFSGPVRTLHQPRERRGLAQGCGQRPQQHHPATPHRHRPHTQDPCRFAARGSDTRGLVANINATGRAAPSGRWTWTNGVPVRAVNVIPQPEQRRRWHPVRVVPQPRCRAPPHFGQGRGSPSSSSASTAAARSPQTAGVALKVETCVQKTEQGASASITATPRKPNRRSAEAYAHARWLMQHALTRR